MEFYRTAEIVGDKGQVKLDILFDSGASVSFVKKSIAKDIATIICKPETEEFQLGKAGEVMKVNEATLLEVRLDGKRISDEFFVSDELSEEVIIGSTTMQKWHIKLDFESDTITIGRDLSKLKLI